MHKVREGLLLIGFELLPGGILFVHVSDWLGLGGVFEFDILIYPFKKIDFMTVAAITKNITIACFSNDSCPFDK